MSFLKNIKIKKLYIFPFVLLLPPTQYQLYYEAISSRVLTIILASSSSLTKAKTILLNGPVSSDSTSIPKEPIETLKTFVGKNEK